ncbi:MAG: FHA domain-containing protein [Gammaproteobacteria bacterium]|nr:MAG: FHA domain-containing protein [Gammaproteobacteria bacterium]
MAYIFDIANNKYIALAPHHTFGRLANAVDTRIDKPYISKLHAAIEWDGQDWRIKNLGLNGTWFNGTLLNNSTGNESQVLRVNDKFHLAELNDPGFKVVDLEPPADMLWPMDGVSGATPQPIYLSRYHLLPDTNAPELAIYFDEQHQQWQMEMLNAQREHMSYELNDGDLIQLGTTQWQLMRAQICGPTEAHIFQTQHLGDMEFVFNLSLDEESTQLELVSSEHKIDLAVRNHHYLLAHLARVRAADTARGLDIKSQGWIYTDQLASELGLDATHMNIYIFRLRKQIADSIPTVVGLQCLLERRSGKIRFGCEKFKIYKGASLTLASPQSAS